MALELEKKLKGEKLGHMKQKRKSYALEDLVAAKIVSCDMEYGLEDGKPYTNFQIEVSTRESSWTVSRRYAEFRQLHEALKRRLPLIKELDFPAKKMFASLHPKVVEERRRKFQSYLSMLLQLKSRPLELEWFLQLVETILHLFNPVNVGSFSDSIFVVPSRELDEKPLTPGPANASTTKTSRSRRRPKLDESCFEVLRVIGQGSFATVYLVKKTYGDGEMYAMKVLKKHDLYHREHVEHARAERRILASASHPFLSSLAYAFQSPDKLFILTNFLAGGELFVHLKRFRTFNENMVRFYLSEIVLAVSYLHSCQIIYRDLKPENVLLDAEGHIKLIDFGLSRDGMSPGVRTYTFCGTPEYLAPEMLINKKKRKGYGMEVDWWSVGIIAYEMLTGLPPYYDKSIPRMCNRILKEPIEFPPNIHTTFEMKSLIAGLLVKNPHHRAGLKGQYSGEDVKFHPFFDSVDWDLVLAREVDPPFVPRGTHKGENFEFDGKRSILELQSEQETAESEDDLPILFPGFTFRHSLSSGSQSYASRSA